MSGIFSVGRLILMESLYFYNFLYDSFIYSMLKYNINILALKKDGKLDMSITPDTQLCRDESMLVLGKYASIQKCFRL